jgi:rhamnogalacturonan endolyase
MIRKITLLALSCLLLLSVNVLGQRQMEKLDRGLVAVKDSSGVFISWRILGTEFNNTGYNLYRDGKLINKVSSTEASNYIDASGTLNSSYYVKAVVGGKEQVASETVKPWKDFYKTIPLQIPAGMTMPDSSKCTYKANDCSVGDVNGDGKYEIIMKWDPTNSKDNSRAGYTGNVYLDAYTLDGKRLWRIDLGKNIRAGAHYTQFLVYDFDGDGKAEVVCKTAPGTKDGLGNYLTGAAAGTDNNADYRNKTGKSIGYVLSGPEYLTIFRGSDGKELQTVNYDPPRGEVGDWGDTYGNRLDRYLACVAYLDGKTPSFVMCRGYYTRTYLAAYNWNGKSITKKWAFDSNDKGNEGYRGQGCHSLCVGDVDGDGKDEIVYGACTIDHDGKGLYTTGLGHGDALHLGDFDPTRPGLEVWQVHENTKINGGVAGSFRDAKTGEVIFKFMASGDVGRGNIAAMIPGMVGAQCWSAGPLYSCKGEILNTPKPTSDNFSIWWDGDDNRELLDGNHIDKLGKGRLVSLGNYENAIACNGTKNTPNLQADIFGDWREEVILHSADNSKLIIFTTTAPTTRRLYTLMHDPEYRLSIAWQNVAYNQPPDVSFYFGPGMSTPPTPKIIPWK